MSWRQQSIRRAERNDREDRDLPPSMRAGNPGRIGRAALWLDLGQAILGFGAVAVLSVVGAWQSGEGVTLRILLLMLAFAAIFAIRVARRPKVRNANLRKLNRK